ncbi:CARDB domain-containing protein [Cellulophaga lytica]|nr:CARDB domain-containing protein [Cellulophaga lytica]
MKKNYLFILLILFVNTTIGQIIPPDDIIFEDDGIRQGTTINSFSNITYDTYNNNCKTKSLYVSFNRVREREMQFYSIQVLNTYTNNWISLKTVPKDGSQTYSVKIDNLDDNLTNDSNLQFRINIIKGLQNFGIRFIQGSTKIVPAKKSNCIEPGQEKPNLMISEIFLENNSNKYRPLNGDQPIIVKDSEFKLSVRIKNNGNIKSKASTMKIYFNTSNNTEGVNYTQLADINFSELSPGATREYTYTDYTYNSLLGSVNLNTGRLYYFFIYVDYEPELIDELNEEDNNYSFSFNYLNTAGKNGPIGIWDDFEFAENPHKKPYNVDIYDLTGKKIISKIVKNINEENQIIENLPSKLYIIKSKHNSTRKVYK